MDTKYQVKLFDSHNGIVAMEAAANSWLIAAASEVYIVDRQVIATTRTADASGGAIEPYFLICIWFKDPPPAEPPRVSN